MDGNKLPPNETTEGTDDHAVPHMTLSSSRSSLDRGRLPAKVFATKSTLASRSLMGTAKTDTTTLHERLHGKAPLVKWTRNVARKTPPLPIPSGPTPPAPAISNPATEPRGENMSERFIAERLLSDRGAAFNPQIPRRTLEIPSAGSTKGSEADLEGKRLVVGKQVSLSGEIGGCEKLLVEGKVDATLRDIKSLDVGAQGSFKGTAEVESAHIAGSFEGTLKVSGHLDIGANATVKGTVSYGTIAVANGGKLLGTIESA
jgi:cytoskeletal protein CcmA (bactofilin family)